ncbi:uncharacterized protein LOC128214998 [Mya arenaria]|uniref:uncharacterized protein LOC128214998 n=1 Tax=Mya arenaria TaxID=6604 RepID=UPI0022E68202|nr:uncharacterized protein LOC128214998 [Mya arenaria]
MEAFTQDVDVAEDNSSPLLTIIQYASLYIASGMTTSVYIIEGFFHTISTAMASIVYFVTATLDVVLRSPVTVITTLLSLIQNILNGTLYILLDVILFCMKECLVFAIRAIMFILSTCFVSILTVISVAISLLSTTLVGYISIIDLVVFNIVFPVCDVLFWILAGLPIVVGSFYLLGKLAHERVWGQEGIKYLFALPVLYASVYIWRKVCGVILSYIVHPICYICILVYCMLVIVKLCQIIVHEVREFKFKEALKRNPTKNDALCKECVICFEENVFVTIVPCMHSNICQSCISRVKMDSNLCPLCREIIQDVQIPLTKKSSY